MLKQMLSPDVVDGDECYEFTWVGKRASIVEANKPIRKTLRPCPEESKDWDATENLYIEGDNLEVLKLLQEAYLGKVKMIYIDPPYNTGNDFIYADDFMRSQEEENEQMGMYDENENRLFKNTDTNGRFHSDWCSMMYSRLMLARNLLSDDGIIMVSIDNNESHNLRKICEDVFGASNFVSEIIIQNNPRGRQSDRFIATAHEYLLCFCKNSSMCVINGMPLSEEQKKEYCYSDENGLYRLLGLRQRGVASLREDRPDMFFPIFVNPDTLEISLIPHDNWNEVIPKKSDGRDGRWMWGKEKCKTDSSRLVARLIGRRGEYDIFVKDYLERDGNARTRKFKSIWDDKSLNNQVGTQEVKALLSGDMMSFPKSRAFIQMICQMGSESNSIIMDFFSGSATTAHAVMQLNAEERQSLERSIENLDKSDPDYHSKFQALSSQLSQTGKRKFIMVQLPEPCDEQSEAYKAGYKNICEIGKERIRRAGKQILELSLKSFEKEGLIEKVSKSKISALSSKNSLGKEGVIEKYAGELSEIRSLEEVYGSGGAGVSSHQAAAAGGDLRTGRPNASGGSFHPVEYCGGAVAGNAGVYPVFESGKGITGGVGNTVIALRSLALLNELGYRVCLERFRGDQQNACGTDQTSELQTLNSKLQALNSKLSLDTGFRVLKLDDSNVKDVYYAADEYDQQNLANMISNIKDDRTDLDLLFGCLLDWGVPLSMPYTSEQIEGCTVHTYNDGDLIACFDANIPESVVKEIASRKPLRAVFRDSSFANSPAKINVFEIFKLYMPEDADDISKRVRVI